MESKKSNHIKCCEVNEVTGLAFVWPVPSKSILVLLVVRMCALS